MMPVTARYRTPTSPDLELYWDATLVGAMPFVQGLDSALAAVEPASRGMRVSVPDLGFGGLDAPVEKWFTEWMRTMGDRRDLSIRDNRNGKEIKIYGATVRHKSPFDAIYMVSIEWVEAQTD